MKRLYCYLFAIIVILSLHVPLYAEFLPEPNGDRFGLEYGESIAGMTARVPVIDGNLDDWKYAVWIAFDSDKELFRGKGVWKGKDDLTLTWSTMYDSKNFYFAAAVKDDVFKPSDNAAEMWLGDCIFLYIDWAGKKAEVSSKPNFALVNGKATIADPSAKNPQIIQSEIAIVLNKELGKGGTIYEVAMPFEFLTKEAIANGSIIGFTPGYEEGTNNPEGKAGTVFMDWGAVDPDQPQNLGKLRFGDKLSVNMRGSLITTWSNLKQ